MRILTRIVLLLAFSLILAMPGRPGIARLALLGDVMLGRAVAEAHAGGGWEEALEPIATHLASADLALANLESPICKRLEKASYDLRASPSGLAALTAAGIDLVSIENNHSLDCGPQGKLETISALEMVGIEPVETLPIFRQVNGLRLAFLAFSDVPDPLDAETACQSIRQARQTGAIVVVSIHWGVEYQRYPSPRQRELAQSFSAAGAALVWGHHSHVIQPAEQQNSKEYTSPTLIAYSLGNALFDQGAPPDTSTGALLLVTLSPTGVKSVQAVPFEIDPHRGKLLNASHEVAERAFTRLNLNIIENLTVKE